MDTAVKSRRRYKSLSGISSLSPEDTCCKMELRPFLHQVSGTKLMFYLNKNTICKALIPSESEFYKNMPYRMRKFTAGYRGCMKVELEETKDGLYKFIAAVPYSLMAYTTSDLYNTARSDNSTHTTLECYEDPFKKAKACSVLSQRLAKIFHDKQHAQAPRFADLSGAEVVLLENLVAGLKHPSVLDIKMGSRTFGDTDMGEKKQRKIERAEKSTSSTLFMRLNGMQKYNGVLEKYETLGKLDGQNFTDEELITTLIDFFSDGIHHRTDLIGRLISKLQRLYDCVAEQHSYRFYSSSLLIIYDGGQLLNEVDVKMIDFAHTVQYKSDNGGPDEGYLQGIQSLIDIFSVFLHAHSLDNE